MLSQNVKRVESTKFRLIERPGRGGGDRCWLPGSLFVSHQSDKGHMPVSHDVTTDMMHAARRVQLRMRLCL